MKILTFFYLVLFIVYLSIEVLWRVAGVVLANWCAGTVFIWQTRNFDPWEFNLFIDSLAMMVVLWHPAGKAQVLLGLLYIGQICLHIVYGSRELLSYPNDILFYYNALTVIAWAQLLVLGGWASGIGGAIVDVGRWAMGRAPRRKSHLRAYRKGL